MVIAFMAFLVDAAIALIDFKIPTDYFAKNNKNGNYAYNYCNNH